MLPRLYIYTHAKKVICTVKICRTCFRCARKGYFNVSPNFISFASLKKYQGICNNFRFRWWDKNKNFVRVNFEILWKILVPCLLHRYRSKCHELGNIHWTSIKQIKSLNFKCNCFQKYYYRKFKHHCLPKFFFYINIRLLAVVKN
jgi:hypothetical protein